MIDPLYRLNHLCERLLRGLEAARSAGKAHGACTQWEQDVESIPRILPKYRAVLAPYLPKLRTLVNSKIRYRHFEADTAHELVDVLAWEVLRVLSPLMKSGSVELCIKSVNQERANQQLSQLDWSEPVEWWVWEKEILRERAILGFLDREGALTKESADAATAEAMDAAEQVPRQDDIKPYWDDEKSELSYGGDVIRRIKQPAKNLRTVLRSFQELGWSRRISDPLPGGKNPQRLNDTVKRLNKSQSAIRFSADGTGTGFCWKSASERLVHG